MDNKDMLKRPGGWALTEDLLDAAALPAASRVLDVGCGSGATVFWLRARGLAAEGLDCALPADLQGEPGFYGFPVEQIGRLAGGAPYDAFFCECCLSLFADAAAVLADLARLARPGGWLLLSDLYALEEAACLGASCLLPQAALRRILRVAGWQVRLWRDESACLRAYLLQRIWQVGRAAAYRELGCAEQGLGGVAAGYYLLAAQKLAEGAEA